MLSDEIDQILADYALFKSTTGQGCHHADYCDNEAAPFDDWLSIVIWGGHKDGCQVDNDEVNVHGNY